MSNVFQQIAEAKAADARALWPILHAIKEAYEALGWCIDAEYTMPFFSQPEAFIKIHAEFAIPGVFAWMDSARDVPTLPLKPPLLVNWPHMATNLKTLSMNSPVFCESATVAGRAKQG